MLYVYVDICLYADQVVERDTGAISGMYICMYLHTYVCIYSCINVCIYVICICVYKFIC
jgi:hypothetical protein